MIAKRALLVGVLVLAGIAMAHADNKATNDPLKDPEVQKTLRAMKDASTWYHPDQFGEFTGMRNFAHHHYATALKYFKVGAYYADKMSQLCIGLMYLNGNGVDKDPATAYAWLQLAAERKYAKFVATANAVKATLTPEQLRRADKVHTRLAARYADKVAKPRMVTQLRLGQMQLTGSRTGFNAGASQLRTKPSCNPTPDVAGEDVPEAGCGGSSEYAESRWNPKKYFAARDAQWKATVSVGALQQVGQSKTSGKKPAKNDHAVDQER